MDKRKQTLNVLEQIAEELETLDISFLKSSERSEAEYAVNEALLDIQEIEGICDAG
jgi:predicted RNA-binding protein with EMAP domain